MKFMLSDFRCCLLFFFLSITKSEKFKNSPNAKIFEEHQIVPHLLPSNPEELCNVIYEPNLIIATSQPYYMYQVQGIPEIIWNFNVEKFYTVVILGAIQNEIQHPSTTAPVLKNDTDDIKPPVQSWHHCVITDVRKNNLKSGTIIQPLNANHEIQPNETHKLVFTFAIYEQPKKLDLQVDDKDNSPKKLLERYFTPLLNYAQSFKDSILIAANFFYAVRKPKGLLERYFTPLSNYAQNFKESIFRAANFFYAVRKPGGLVLDSSPVRFRDMKW